MMEWKTKEYLEKQEKNEKELKKAIDRLDEMAKKVKELTWDDIYKELGVPKHYLTALQQRFVCLAFNAKGVN